MPVQQISAQISLRRLHQDFGLVKVSQPGLFPEWQVDQPGLTDLERSTLSHLRQNFMYQLEWGQLSENLVKMVVLSPLLDLAGFYQSKLRVQDEASVELAVEDQGMLYRGKIDVLVCDERFWILVIEAKPAQFSLINAIPQWLAYMLVSPNSEAPVYGLVTNGSNFRFIKLNLAYPPSYALSDELLFDRGDDLAQVLQILKTLQIKGDR
ncbi:MAG: restriction endonuclease subunit R [Leptolyngbyaceae cyanobacterium SM2_5_2]|nr:restriction endonuclease subunit R [Leptolyngbyaceae cyanobacterium SM2_5_2]